MRQKLYACLAILLGFLVPLVGAEIVLQVVGVYGGLSRAPVNAANPIRHYVPNQSFHYTFGPLFELANSGKVNNYGFINDQAYDPDAPSPLLAAIGDSYVEAVMVPYAETVQGRLATALAGRARVYSFAMASAALSDYLAYADYLRESFRPVGLVVVVVGNDFDQSLDRYRHTYGYHEYSRAPDGEWRHQLVDYRPGGLEGLIEKSALFRYVFIQLGAMQLVANLLNDADFVSNTAAKFDAERLSLSQAFVDYFLAELPGRAGLARDDIVLAVDGIRPELYCETCLAAVAGSYVNLMRSYLIEKATAAGYEVVDLQPLFRGAYDRDGRRMETDVDNHWNSHGHAAVAAALLKTRLLGRFKEPVKSQ